MAIINLYNVPVIAYFVKSGAIVNTFNGNLFIPVFSSISKHNEQIIDSAHLVTSGWDTAKAEIPDFEIAGYTGAKEAEWWKNYFPSMFGEVESSSTYDRIYYEFVESGFVASMMSRPLKVYGNINDAIADTNMIFSISYTTYSGNWLHVDSGSVVNFITVDDSFENAYTYTIYFRGAYYGVYYASSQSYTINVPLLRKLITGSEDKKPGKVSLDPYGEGGESETGGGTGDFDGSSDPIDFPDLPTLSATDAGFITLFNPSAAQLKALATYMWSNSLFDLATWKKIFADPMDAILGLTIVPVDVPAGGAGSVKVGNISTDVTMTYAATQYVEVDCGTLNVNEYWGAYLDYEPFTKAEIYLPYIGTHAISIDDIMGKAVHVKYHIDILSGACAAYVKCGDSVLYTFIGQCASSIPITGSDMTNVINGVISAAVSIGSMVATGGASAPLAAPALANTAVNSMKPSIEKSGSMSGTGGMLGIQTPYLILTRPRQCLPAAQNEFMGYPSFISSVMGDLSGYTEVEQVHLDGIAATDAEISEIETLLKSGVIF